MQVLEQAAGFAHVGPHGVHGPAALQLQMLGVGVQQRAIARILDVRARRRGHAPSLTPLGPERAGRLYAARRISSGWA